MKPTITRLSTAVLISSTVLSTLVPAHSYAATYEGTVNTSILNVRSATSTTSDIVGKLTEGETVQVYTTNDNWAQIEFEGEKRYVSSTYLTLKSTVTKTATTASTTATSAYKADANVNLRSSTSTSANVLTTIPKGATVTYISSHGATGSWMKVTYGKYTGYVVARYFTPSAPVETPYYANKTAVLYNSTGSGATKLATIPAGAKVTHLASLGATGSWFKIQYGTKIGYAPSRNFSTSLLTPDTSTPETTTPYFSITNVALYNSSASGATKIATIPSGAQVEQIAMAGLSSSWFKIRYNGVTGYAAARNFSKTKPEVVVRTPYYAARDLVLYKSSASGADRLRTIRAGSKVTQVSDAGLASSWFKIEYDGVTGYAAARNFSTTPPEVIVIKPYYAIRNVAMYSSSASGATKIDTIPFGAKIEQISQSGLSSSWFKVRYDGKTGYAASRHFSVEKPEVIVVTDYYTTQRVVLYDRSASPKTKIAVIPTGTKVQQISEAGLTSSLYKIKYGSLTGYATASYFADKPPVPEEQLESEREVEVVVANNGTLNVRNKAVDGAVIGKLANGTVVKVKPIVGSDWGVISYLVNGSLVKGYISLTYTKPYTPPVAGSKEMVITETPYPYTLASMITTQRNVFSQSDAFRNEDAYVHKSLITKSTTGELFTTKLQYLKSTASSSATTLATLPNHAKLAYLGAQQVGTVTWYKVKYGSFTGYVLATATAPAGKVVATELFATRFQYLKATASSTSTNVTSVSTNTKLEYLGTQKVGSTTWYKVKYGVYTGYINAIYAVGSTNVLKDASMTSHSFGVINPGEEVAITGETDQYYTITYYRPSGYDIRVYDRSWRRATNEEITRHVSPSSFATTSREYFQFLDLSKGADLTAPVLNKSLVGKGILEGRGQAFIDASRTHNVNEIYLLSHALLETGHGTSALATGILVSSVDGKAVTPKTVYNMYGIGAIDGNAHVKGAERAYKEGWFTPEAAIIGGAKFIGDEYINDPDLKQNTLYKMRFNPSNPGTNQYASDIAWATKQTTNIYNMYQDLESYTLYFDVPKFQ
ncbi:SH3 domain-containing protein [Exiguobacterium sp. s26]|uniref:SH3 domain-containing protein n=1 Tax=Exiguobacterium sp. s26 TaxID=2751231 RepID=UPI001BE72760|nr:SH3 domain-containing protein [Exiguobacterium sp. s26]